MRVDATPISAVDSTALTIDDMLVGAAEGSLTQLGGSVKNIKIFSKLLAESKIQDLSRIAST